MPDAIAAIRSAIEADRQAIEWDVGLFALEDDPAHEEVVLKPTDANKANTEVRPAYRCYLVEGRLVLDDYFPTEEERQA